MWKNGYSESERNAISSAFPSDYKFHYPELAVLFDLAEEDTEADLSERALKQLQAIAAFEAGMGAAMQELVVREAAASFKDAFPGNATMQDAAFAAAVKSLSGQQLGVSEDP